MVSDILSGGPIIEKDNGPNISPLSRLASATKTNMKPKSLGAKLSEFIFSMVVNVFSPFWFFAEIGEILHLQYSNQVVLVSYPESVIQGVNSMLVTSIHTVMTTLPRACPSSRYRIASGTSLNG